MATVSFFFRPEFGRAPPLPMATPLFTNRRFY
jgi:hypothetical protein